jgi:glutaredoxin 3
MKDVEIFTKPGCPYCVRAKALLDRKGVRYREVDVSRDPAKAREVVERSGRLTVPQVFADGTPLGGYDDIQALESQGRLDDALGRDGTK